MSAVVEQGGAQASPTFNPAVWLDDLVQIGGGYALASDRRLWLIVDACPVDQLLPLTAQLIGQPERTEAIRSLIERRHCGEVA